MKRSDLKKILMEEAARALALRKGNKGSPDTVSENVPNPEWRSRVDAAAAAKPEAADTSKAKSTAATTSTKGIIP